jgi:hypothetical protein
MFSKLKISSQDQLPLARLSPANPEVVSNTKCKGKGENTTDWIGVLTQTPEFPVRCPSE